MGLRHAHALYVLNTHDSARTCTVRTQHPRFGTHMHCTYSTLTYWYTVVLKVWHMATKISAGHSHRVNDSAVRTTAQETKHRHTLPCVGGEFVGLKNHLQVGIRRHLRRRQNKQILMRPGQSYNAAECKIGQEPLQSNADRDRRSSSILRRRGHDGLLLILHTLSMAWHLLNALPAAYRGERIGLGRLAASAGGRLTIAPLRIS
jgi:hypothetical protein